MEKRHYETRIFKVRGLVPNNALHWPRHWRLRSTLHMTARLRAREMRDAIGTRIQQADYRQALVRHHQNPGCRRGESSIWMKVTFEMPGLTQIDHIHHPYHRRHPDSHPFTRTILAHQISTQIHPTSTLGRDADLLFLQGIPTFLPFPQEMPAFLPFTQGILIFQTKPASKSPFKVHRQL